MKQPAFTAEQIEVIDAIIARRVAAAAPIALARLQRDQQRRRIA
jgi:hypothetical protein